MGVAIKEGSAALRGGPRNATVANETQILDGRFRSLVGDDAWAQLPECVRQRFSKRIAPGSAVIYRGEVVLTKLSPAGRTLAFFARLIGSPLPLDDGATGPSVVTVTEEAGARGQTWTRSYTRPGGASQIIRSMKCFRGGTGLEEHVAAGIGMALRVTVEDSALYFRSESYFVRAGPFRLSVPRLLSPGAMTIVHRQEADATFAFHLTLTHPWLGRLLEQIAYYRDP